MIDSGVIVDGALWRVCMDNGEDDELLAAFTAYSKSLAGYQAKLCEATYVRVGRDYTWRRAEFWVYYHYHSEQWKTNMVDCYRFGPRFCILLERIF